jgi:hypothetical protein
MFEVQQLWRHISEYVEHLLLVFCMCVRMCGKPPETTHNMFPYCYMLNGEHADNSFLAYVSRCALKQQEAAAVCLHIVACSATICTSISCMAVIDRKSVV